MTLSPSTADLPEQIGPYRIDAKLRETRTLLIYQAQDTLYDRPVLLKTLAPAFAENRDFVRQFISLGRAAARLHHPHLVEVYEAGHADGVNYIAQEYVAGGTLASRLQKRHHPYLLYDVTAILEPLAAALDYAHANGVVHGALSAESILFTKDNQPKIADVGLLALERLGAQATFATNVSSYMAPEQARGESGGPSDLDARSDLYTLGIIAYLLLAGETPFAAENPLALLRKIIDEAPPIDEELGTLPSGVQRALARCLAKSATTRYATATAFAKAMADGEPTSTAAPVDAPTPMSVTEPASASNMVDDRDADADEPWAEEEPWAEDEEDDPSVIDVEPIHVAWAEAEQPFIPMEKATPFPDEAAAQEIEDDNQPSDAQRNRRQRPLLTLSILGATALLLSLVTLGRFLWANYGEQMVDAALTPYAAAQASRLTPPQPPTMLTVAELTASGVTGPRTTMVDTPLFAGSLVQTSELLGHETLLANQQAFRRDANAGVAELTGSPPMVVVAPSSTPTDAPTDTPFPTDTPVPTATEPPTETPTELPTSTPLPTDTPLPTETPTTVPSATATETPTATPTSTPSASPTATESPTPSPSPTTATTEEGLSGRIVYTRWDPRVDRYDLIFYSIVKEESWPIVRNRRQPDFAPNGQLIASGDGGFIDNLVLMGTNGENPVPASAHSEDAHPHWSPSGKQLVFDSTLVGDGRHRLYLHSDETLGQPLTPMMFEAWELFGRYPIFLASGQIAYNGCDVWENASNCGLFRVDTRGGQPQAVTTYPGDIPTDNLGNEALVTSNRTGDWNVYRVDAFSGEIQQLTDSAGRDGLATASPDGSHIAFVSDRSGTWAVYVMDPDGSNERKLFEIGGGFGSGDRDWLQERISWGR